MTDLSFLTAKDLIILEEKANFTQDQKIILRHMFLQDLNDDGMMIELRLSRNKFYKIKNDLFQKLIRTAVQN